jgi:hypothetical protein
MNLMYFEHTGQHNLISTYSITNPREQLLTLGLYFRNSIQTIVYTYLAVKDAKPELF